MTQPTIDEISAAWTAAIELDGIGGAQTQARADLRDIRKLPQTFCGFFWG
jgi:hypothetical protein